MRRAALVSLSTLLALAQGAPLSAHHSIAIFDGQRVEEIHGVVTEFHWINPHVWLHVASQQGEDARRWRIEMRSPNSMMRDGWRANSVSAGDRVTVYVHPLLVAEATNAARRGLLARVILPDGSVLGGEVVSSRSGEH